MSLLQEFLQSDQNAPQDPAKKVLFAVLNDLIGRGGFDGVWDGLDAEIREEILTTNLGIVTKNLHFDPLSERIREVGQDHPELLQALHAARETCGDQDFTKFLDKFRNTKGESLWRIYQTYRSTERHNLPKVGITPSEGYINFGSFVRNEIRR